MTNLLIQLVTGILGGHAAAVAAKEHNHRINGLRDESARTPIAPDLART